VAAANRIIELLGDDAQPKVVARSG
jgi:hypothetical protein